MLQDDPRLLEIISSQEEKTKFQKGVGNQVVVLLDLLLIINNELETFLCLQGRVHVG